jgi:prepilin-type N-terminal cleavage/methylation domain-containing protein
MTQRRGFTLVEVLIALVVMGLVTGAIYKLLIDNQRLSLAQAEQVSLQSNVRTGSLIVPNELRELNNWAGSVDATQIDVIDADPDGITYRAMRGLGFLCQASTATNLRVTTATWNGSRGPDASRDGVYVFVDQDPDEDDDDGWTQIGDITGVATSTCGATAAISLTVAGAPAGLPAGTPVRIFEVMRLDLDQDAAGDWWLYAESVSGGTAPQPVLGPLTNDGFDLDYLDSAGNPTATLNAIASIRVTVRGLTDDAVRAGGTGALGHPEEALATQVLLRNSIRP